MKPKTFTQAPMTVATRIHDVVDQPSVCGALNITGMITLCVNHPDSDLIMKYLYENCDIHGNEVYLKDELLTDFLVQTEIWGIENMLYREFDVEIDLPRDLRLIEKEEILTLK
jgi:hypothetical protein